MQRNRIDPGRAKTSGVFKPLRDNLVRANVYRPCNTQRNKGAGRGGGGTTSVLDRPQLLAQYLPWLTRYNYARS